MRKLPTKWHGKKFTCEARTFLLSYATLAMVLLLCYCRSYTTARVVVGQVMGYDADFS